MNFTPLKKSMLTAVITLSTASVYYAQVTTSSIQGVVASAGNAVVTAVHVPTGTTYTGITNSSGNFTLSNMRVGGPYKVEISKDGRVTDTYEDIYIELGQPFVLNPKSLAKTKEIAGVVITGTRRTDTNKTGASTNVGQKQIQELPQTSRSITDFTRLTPQSNGTSFAGRDARYNNLQIDGANFNNGFGLSTNPLPGGNSQPIALDAIQEISVNIAPFDVSQSGFTGAGINAVTKSGTNKFHGSLYGYYNGKELNGWKINGDKIDKLSGAKLVNGLTVGGPIVKNKLFFFISAERETATGSNASGANLWKASQNGVANAGANITRVKEADLIAVQNHLINVWGYDPGRYQGYANEAEQTGDKLLARLDWNISSKHKAAFRYNILSGNSMQVANGNSGPQPRSSWNRVSENSMTFENGNYSTKNKVQSFTAELNSAFTDKISNKLLFTFSKIQDTRDTPSKKLFPFVDIWDGSATGGNYISFGTELFSYLNDVINDNYSFINNLSYNTGKHNFLVGVAYDLQKFGNSYTRMGTGYYRYNSVADFLTTGTGKEVAPIMYGLTYPYAGQETYSRVNFGLGSAYIQDRISLTDKLNITLGIRAEKPFYLNDLTPNPSIDNLEFMDQDGNKRKYSSGQWPTSKIQISPRFGFNFDALGDRSLILRGGTGIFSGRVPFVWLTNMPTNAGVLQNTIEPNGYNAVSGWIKNIRFHPEDMYYYLKNVPAGGEKVFISSPNAGAPGTIALVDSNFKMPSVWRSSFGIDYRIPTSPVTLTADVLYTKDVNGVFQYNPNRIPTGLKMTYAEREFYPAPASGQKAVYQYNSAIGANNVTVLTNSSKKGYSFSATFGASVRPVYGFSGSAYYTYSDAKDISSNPGSSANSSWSGLPSVNNPNEQILGISDFALPHRVVANISYNIKGTTIGVYYNGAHQGRYSYTYSNDVNGDGISGDLLYIPTNSANIKFTNITTTANGQTTTLYTADQQRAAFDKFVADNGLEKYRGQIVPRNAFLLPWLNRVDVRIAQDLFKDRFAQGHKLQLSLDIINFGNLLNSEWGVQNSIISNGRSVLSKVGNTATADPSFQMLRDGSNLVTSPYRDSNSRFTTWSATFGIKYSF